MVLVLSSARLIFCLVLLACVGSAFSIKCPECDDPCPSSPKTNDCGDDGACYREMEVIGDKETGKVLSQRCADVAEIELSGLPPASGAGKKNEKCKSHLSNGNGTRVCYCNGKNDCFNPNSESTKPTVWTSLLWLGLTCFYIRFKGL